MKHFENLSPSEVQQLLDTIPLITLLIAGADDNIDEDELKWADKLTEIRGYAQPDDLLEYYEQVESNFDERLTHFMNAYSENMEKRNHEISLALSHINPVLAKLDQNFAAKLYHSFITFADQIAKASGGFLRFMTVNKEEEKWVHLPMITPIQEIQS